MSESTKQGIVYLVGAGPGDPGLLTVRGRELLESAEVVVYDNLANPVLLGYLPEGCERLYVGKRAGSHSMRQPEINALLVETCLAGRRIVRLKGGDPYVFGRGGEEALALADAGCAFEVVPGVTAGVAATAYAGIPVTHRGLATNVTLVTGHEDPTKGASHIDWPSLAHINGTLVFYMGVRNLPMIVEKLVGNGRAASTPAALVRWGTMPKHQAVTGTLETIVAEAKQAGMKPPALIVVGEVVSLRDRLGWFEKRRLLGRRIVVTRSRAQAGDLSRQLADLGADVIEFPVIRIAPAEDPRPLADAVRRIGDFDWVILTSVNGVDAFFGALAEASLDARSLAGVRLCAIGPATAQRIEERGLIVDMTPPQYIAESVAETFETTENLSGKRLLLPRADIARSFLPEALEKMGAEVEEIVAYRTVLEEPENIQTLRADLAAGRIDAVTFTSSSTVRNFAALVGEETLRKISPDVCLASIGPQTTKTLKECIQTPTVEASEYTIDGVIKILRTALEQTKE
jgi:uroporphyrinogen III methyltransferase / synthase